MVHKFVGLGDPGEKIYLYKTKDKIFRQVLWGDWLKIDESHPDDEMGDGWLPVLWAPNSKNPQRVFIPEVHTTDTRPLEIIFLDVGQGDGLVLITPEGGQEERIIVMDAGEGRNMQAFLNGRFKAYRGFDFHAAVITHPDMDHYLGFKAIFADHDIGFRTIYHNGLVERPVAGTFKKLGGVFEDAASGVKYINEIAEDTDDIEELFSDSAANKKYVFPGVMHEAIKNPKINKFRMLSTHHGTVENNRTYMPGFAPADGREYNIEVLGPVVEFDSNANPRLRRISSRYGETKNGHSVILRLHYGDFKVLFGGDLNYPAEKFLLKHYTQRTKFPSKKSSDYKEMVKEARDWFGAEVMKVCHHGSEKVTDAFLESVNPACFVISSGDQEGHVHPRPDLLGRLGRFGRGESPVLLSTELQRSTREREDKKLVKQVLKEVGRLAEKPTDKLEKSLKANIYKLAKTNVEVYGAIYLKTDGKRLITAFKIEAKSDKEKWFYFEYAIDPSGELKLI
jgi:beta-lactamase superfamily II metal-dependent hydrolase